MKCPSCQFENMPGQDRCARCRGSLKLGDIDIEPPRASGPVVLRYTRHRAGNVFGGLLYAISRFHKSLRLPIDISGAPLDAVLLSLIPGMGQVATRRRSLGWALLGTWCGLMILSLLGYGTVLGGWCLIAAVLLHATAIALVMRPAATRTRWATRLMMGLLIVVALQLTLYPGLAWATGRFAGGLPIRNVQDADAVRNGDMALYKGPWLRPDRFVIGDLVAYRVEGGFGVDRVVGLEGDHIAIVSGRLLVNNKPLPDGAEPLNGSGRFPDFEFDVAPGHLAILPSTLDWRSNQAGLLVQMLRRNSHIAENDVLGPVFWRLRPFGRFGGME